MERCLEVLKIGIVHVPIHPAHLGKSPPGVVVVEMGALFDLVFVHEIIRLKAHEELNARSERSISDPPL